MRINRFDVLFISLMILIVIIVGVIENVNPLLIFGIVAIVSAIGVICSIVLLFIIAYIYSKLEELGVIEWLMKELYKNGDDL